MIDPTYISQQGLQGLLLGNKLTTVDYAEVIILNLISGNVIIHMEYKDGIFTKKLRPGTYGLEIAVHNVVDKRKFPIRIIPINIKGVVLKEKEQREIVIKEGN